LMRVASVSMIVMVKPHNKNSTTLRRVGLDRGELYGIQTFSIHPASCNC